LIGVGDWLAQRTPPPPADLAGLLASVAGDATVDDEAALAVFLVQHAVTLLDTVSADRSGAPQLLLADALITYAMEAAASDHERFEAIAGRAMNLIAATGRGPE
jgi:hypothetical protein